MSMLVGNRQRVTAIVLRRDRRGLWLVPMSAGTLHAVHVDDTVFRADWHVLDYPLDQALARFIAHARVAGATRAARDGLQRLADQRAHQTELALA